MQKRNRPCRGTQRAGALTIGLLADLMSTNVDPGSKPEILGLSLCFPLFPKRIHSADGSACLRSANSVAKISGPTSWTTLRRLTGDELMRHDLPPGDDYFDGDKHDNY